ncbi:MAG: DUF1501 domain-containing protein [Planctomycetes bacterium]|nr:DUF1501 domain-containing protein [Planctomycetota bacterium]
MSRTRPLSRRDFLRQGAVAAGAIALPTGRLRTARDAALAPAPATRTQHVVLLAFAGGVRKKEVLETPANVPNLMRIASAGVSMAKVRCENVGHYGAALSIFTGFVEEMGIRDNERGLNPTLFERLRRDAGLAADQIWLSTAGGAQGRLFAHSDHPDYGAAFAANVLDGDGLFNVEFRSLLESFGRPRPDSEHDRAVLDRLAAALDPDALRTESGVMRPDPEQVQRVSRFVLDELTGNTAELTGPGASDAKAIRVGLQILRTFRPRLLGITLQGHDIAHGSYNGYVDVIRRNDQEVGALWDAIQQDPELRDSTSVLVLPEFGRDADLNERNGLDHGDRSEQMLEVFLIAAGPDFRKGRVLRDDARTIDVCPTVLELLAPRIDARVEGRVIRGLFA